MFLPKITSQKEQQKKSCLAPLPANDMKASSNRVLVIGEECLDIFVFGSSSRSCPDVPAPVFVPLSTSTSYGMAGNTEKFFIQGL